MRTLLKISLLLLFVTPVSNALGNDEQPDRISQRWASWFSDQVSQANKRPLTTPLYQGNLTTTYFTLPSTRSRLRDLTPETDGARTQGLLASTKWLNGSLVTETELANNQGGVGWLQSRIPGDTRTDASTRMIRIGIVNTAGAVRYGMTYRTAGQAFYNGPDQALREAWGEWKNGWTTLRSTIGQQWNNVASDPSQSRLEQTYGRVALMWNKPAWPNLAFTYSRNSLSSVFDPVGIAPQRTNNHTLEAALAYNSARWNARLASSYILGNDLLRSGAESTVKMQMLTASFRPLNTLTIAPMLAYRAEQQEWSGVRIDSPSASLALHYKQSQRLLISAMGNYAGMRSSDRLTDQENVGGKGILAWDIQHSREWATLISFEAGYNRQTNRVTPTADTEDISGLVRVVLASL